ncbi:hypothetical protein ACP275_10G118500 [Erythranthe tilingii]
MENKNLQIIVNFIEVLIPLFSPEKTSLQIFKSQNTILYFFHLLQRKSIKQQKIVFVCCLFIVPLMFCRFLIEIKNPRFVCLLFVILVTPNRRTSILNNMVRRRKNPGGKNVDIGASI